MFWSVHNKSCKTVSAFSTIFDSIPASLLWRNKPNGKHITFILYTPHVMYKALTYKIQVCAPIQPNENSAQV